MALNIQSVTKVMTLGFKGLIESLNMRGLCVCKATFHVFYQERKLNPGTAVKTTENTFYRNLAPDLRRPTF